jgi:type IV pilus assembly protein PilV
MEDTAGGDAMLMKKEQGFAMLEVLISLLVILFGALGIAGMQLMAINNTETARYQNIATMLASSMSAKMQTNFAYWSTLPPPASIWVTDLTIGGSGVPAVPTYTGTCLNTSCTPVQMAAYDLKNWGAAMAGIEHPVDGVVYSGMALPAPQGGAASGSISCLSATPMVCTLTISWSEKNIALGNPTGTETNQLAAGQVTNHSYQTLVSIQQ